MRIYKSSRAKRKRFHRRSEFRMIWRPYWCTEVVHQHGISDSVAGRNSYFAGTDQRTGSA